MFRYLYAYQGSVFNGDTPSYELDPIVGSEVTRAVIFAGKNNLPFNFASCHLYIETSKEMTDKTVYRNLRLYDNLLCLISGQPMYNRVSIDISGFEDVDAIFKEHFAEDQQYNQPGIQHAGLVREYNIIEKFSACVIFFNNLPSKKMKKVERSLHTFVIAEELSHNVNPQMKATVVASLYLSSIDQLADAPELCTYKMDECSVCGKKNIQHQKTSHPDEIEKLMRDLFTGTNLDHGVQLMRRSYSRVRSLFLHEGKLSGGEIDGGWISDNPKNIQFMEDSVNFMTTCRHLLQLYMQKYGNVEKIVKPSL